ncbi:toxin, partial [Salmonella enterica]|nr:toxin [Salmonella enterica]
LDLSPLTENDNIHSLHIIDDIDLKKIDLSPLYEMKNIKKITMKYLKGSIDFSKFQKLETLYITKADAEIDILNIDTLVDLLLVSIKNTNCEFISSLRSLNTLRISSVSIETLSGIELLSNLKSLKITYSPNVIDISSINKIKTLSYLHVEKCKKLTEFSFLRDNESICDLFLSDVDSLSFIPEMKSIKNLKFWNLKDGDLSYLLNSSTLKTVDFHPDKKSYSHRKDEINKKIGK